MRQRSILVSSLALLPASLIAAAVPQAPAQVFGSAAITARLRAGGICISIPLAPAERKRAFSRVMPFWSC
jgi:hypothetical protein